MPNPFCLKQPEWVLPTVNHDRSIYLSFSSTQQEMNGHQTQPGPQLGTSLVPGRILNRQNWTRKINNTNQKAILKPFILQSITGIKSDKNLYKFALAPQENHPSRRKVHKKSWPREKKMEHSELCLVPHEISIWWRQRERANSLDPAPCRPLCRFQEPRSDLSKYNLRLYLRGNITYVPVGHFEKLSVFLCVKALWKL